MRDRDDLAVAVLAASAAALRAQDKPAPRTRARAGGVAEAAREEEPARVRARPTASASRSETGDFRLQIRGYAHFDGRFFPGDDAGAATDTLPAAPRAADRPGHGRQVLRLQPHARLRRRHDRPPGRLRRPARRRRSSASRVGKFKTPVGPRAAAVRDRHPFVERAFPTRARARTATSACRSTASSLGGVVAYRAGVFNGVPTAAASTATCNDGKDLDGPALPLALQAGAASALKDLGLRHRRHHRRPDGRACPPTAPADSSAIVSLVTGIAARRHAHAALAAALVLLRGRSACSASTRGRDSEVRNAPTGTRGRARASAPGRRRPRSSLTGDDGVLRGRAAREALRSREGAVGRPRAGRARQRARGRSDDAFAAGLVDPARSVREAFAWAVGLNWHLTRNLK